MPFIMLLTVILIIVLLVGGYIIMKQRTFVHLDELCKNSMSQIAVQLNSRWDAVQNLAKIAAQYTRYESETILETIRLRRMNKVSTEYTSPSRRNSSRCTSATTTSSTLSVACLRKLCAGWDFVCANA